MKRIGISTDCMCDLPADYLAAHDVHVMQFYIHTATGRFWNESEITSNNILEYLEEGNSLLRTNAPEPEECKAYFEGLLARYDEVVHIATSDKVGLSYPNAQAALALMGEPAKRVTLINSGAISTGLGHMVMQAVALRDEGKKPAEIAAGCDAMRGKISNSFIVPNADYLYRMGYASEGVKILCSLFRVHPVLCTRDGRLAFKAFRVGNYERAVTRYVRSELARGKRIDRRQLFITHAGCPAKVLAQVRAEVDKLCAFDRVTVTKASAIIASCCGPRTVGVLYVCQ